MPSTNARCGITHLAARARTHGEDTNLGSNPPALPRREWLADWGEVDAVNAVAEAGDRLLRYSSSQVKRISLYGNSCARAFWRMPVCVLTDGLRNKQPLGPLLHRYIGIIHSHDDEPGFLVIGSWRKSYFRSDRELRARQLLQQEVRSVPQIS